MRVLVRIKRAVKRVPWLYRVARRVRRALQTGRHVRSPGRIRGLWGRLRRFVLERSARMTGPVADVRYIAVLDGQTLNVDLELPPGVTMGPAAVVELLLSAGRDARRAPARVRADGGRSRVSATVRLDRLGLDRADRWRLSCAVRTTDGTRTFALRGVPTHNWPDGPTVVSPRSPWTGLWYRPDVGPGGRTELSVLPAKLSAELVDLTVRWTETRVVIRVVGGTTAPALIELTSRDGAQPRRVEATVDGEWISAALPVEHLAPQGRAAEWIWDVDLILGGKRLRVGRRLHDLVDCKKVVKPIASVSRPTPGRVIRVRPYLTAGGRLALACNSVLAPSDVNT